MQKKEKKVMENHNVLKVTKSVLIYTFYPEWKVHIKSV